MKLKKIKNEWGILIIILPIIVLTCFTFWYLRSFYRFDFTTMIRVEAHDGIYDLTDIDLSNCIVRLQGDIEYIPAIMTPEEYIANKAQAVTGYPYDTPYATSYMKIKMPDNAVYMMSTGSVNYAHSVYIGNELRHQAGIPADNPEDFSPGYAKIKLEARADDGYIEIYQQGANYVHREGGGHGAMYISSPEIMERSYALSSGTELIIVGLFFALFFVHLILYVVRRSYRPNLTFSLLCFTWMCRMGVTGDKVFYELFPNLGWQLTFRIEYLSLPIAFILLVLLVCQVFDDIVQKWFIRSVNVVSLGFIILSLVADTVLMSWMLLPFEACFTGAIIYLIVRFIMKVPKQVRNKQFKVEQTISLIAYIIFMYATINDVLYHLDVGLIFNYALTYVAMLIFSLFQMTAMFYGTMNEIAIAQQQEQKAKNQAVMLQEMNQLKSIFYSELSHEMKTPLTVISINAQFAAQNIQNGIIDSETITDLNAISSEARRLGQMVTSLVGIGRLQGGFNTIDINKLLNETAKIYQSLFARRNNTLEVQIENRLPLVIGNGDQLIQVLINLFANANRHSQNGTVIITGEVVDDEVMISVSDNGEGIDPELLPHVFEQYCHGENGGNGLGLAICKTIIEEHSGKIDIESRFGKGTRVWFTLAIKGGKD